ncbi:hypothetical protein FISHEDRAFT_58073 [Fistulina hepatica ATCC 64428]|uniref:Uncharacterized protein n=1 Tax=Fistulina hepatica ATCC 64428 TaxID=1128425 RepID=A0A0D7AG71_9AGAR|nr:hypothetical protein FISHEDRAFT_58073 [Fistulina hepatica ATCC 64428]
MSFRKWEITGVSRFSFLRMELRIDDAIGKYGSAHKTLCLRIGDGLKARVRSYFVLMNLELLTRCHAAPVDSSGDLQDTRSSLVRWSSEISGLTSNHESNLRSWEGCTRLSGVWVQLYTLTLSRKTQCKCAANTNHLVHFTTSMSFQTSQFIYPVIARPVTDDQRWNGTSLMIYVCSGFCWTDGCSRSWAADAALRSSTTAGGALRQPTWRDIVNVHYSHYEMGKDYTKASVLKAMLDVFPLLRPKLPRTTVPPVIKF